jgi:hypothetical protein
MSNFEEYIVSSTIEISSHLFKLNVTPKPGSVEFSPVRSILLVRGATFLTGRTGLEIGYGATVYLEDADLFPRVRVAMNKSEKKLRFHSYTSARLPSGVFLFLPEWHAPEDAEQDERVHFVVIKQSQERRLVEAAVVGSMLNIVVDATQFNKLGEHLRKKDLKNDPAIFTFDVNDDGAVRDLRVDGEELCSPRIRKPHGAHYAAAARKSFK